MRKSIIDLSTSFCLFQGIFQHIFCILFFLFIFGINSFFIVINCRTIRIQKFRFTLMVLFVVFYKIKKFGIIKHLSTLFPPASPTKTDILLLIKAQEKRETRFCLSIKQ